MNGQSRAYEERSPERLTSESSLNQRSSSPSRTRQTYRPWINFDTSGGAMKIVMERSLMGVGYHAELAYSSPGLRRFRELTRVCFPKVTHLTGNQACN